MKTLVCPYHKYGRSVLPHNDSNQQRRYLNVMQLIIYFDILLVFVKRELIFFNYAIQRCY